MSPRIASDYQPSWGQYQDMVMIIRFCGAFFHIKLEDDLSKIEGIRLLSIVVPSLLPNTKEFAEVGFLNEYGEGSRYKIEEVIGKGSYGVVCENILFVSATAIHRTIGKELGLYEKLE
nr:mitogen-activated protein kinase 15-like [Tanacetum cinerariifolium]